MNRIPIVAFLVSLWASLAWAGNDYENVLESAYPADGPGAVALVAKNGKVLFRGSRGMANIELGVSLNANSVFRLGSVTKQFTGAAIMLLVEEGKIELDQPIQTYLPDYPDHGHTITVRHLLTHTSGIYNYTAIPAYFSDGRIRRDLSTEELVEVFDDLEMDFTPGERYSYSNSGYVLLGAIVEKVSGHGYADFVGKRIFEPLGMANSHYGGSQLIEGRVAGYNTWGGGFTNASFISMTQPHAAGSLLSTVDDLATWTAALFGGQLLSDQSIAAMIEPYTLNDSTQSPYGFGFMLGDFRGESSIAHAGGINGFATFTRWLPEHKIFTVVLSNNPGNPKGPFFIVDSLASMALGRPYAPKAIKMDANALMDYAGAYEFSANDVRNVYLEGDKLYARWTSDGPRVAIVASAVDEFFFENTFSHIRFERDAGGQVARMHFFPDAAEEVDVGERIGPSQTGARETVAVSAELFDLWAGVYELQPGFNVVITREGNDLISQAPDQAKVTMHASSTTRYFWRGVAAEVEFVPGDDGRAKEFVLHQGGQQTVAKRIQ